MVHRISQNEQCNCSPMHDRHSATECLTGDNTLESDALNVHLTTTGKATMRDDFLYPFSNFLAFSCSVEITLASTMRREENPESQEGMQPFQTTNTTPPFSITSPFKKPPKTTKKGK